ncbi:MAG TPA: response regulator transcription factor [Bacteroidia bacterium]|jgi:two-component system alkaline phosphatase synthesis response regulator PhoP|nr:response regulator transcription factor [Bacteroidia bacterium]
MSDTHKILVVDDEEDILEFLSYNLKKEGYAVYTAASGKEALDIAVKEKPDLVLLDVMMPGIDGMEVCSKMRQMDGMDKTIIAFLTARSEDYSHIAGFDAGADDYINKPIRPRVLMSRIKALLKRIPSGSDSKVLDLGGIRIDRESYLIYKDGTDISLPRKEFELLSLLASRPGKVFPREEILNRVWGDEVVVGDRTIDVHVRKLREKIGEDYIKTVKGVGYKFEF